MTIRVRSGLMLIAALATLGLASCGHYTCGASFGSSTCTGGPPSLSGGGGGSAAAAFVFVANGSATGSIVGYTLNTNAAPPALTFTPNYTAPTTPNNDAGIGMAVAQKQFLYAVFGFTNQIFGWTISSTGTLTPISGSPFFLPNTFVTGATTTFDTHRVVTNPAGTVLFIADEFGEQIFVYQIGTGGVLTAVANSPFSVAPFFPGNLTTDGLGNFLYITETFSDHTSDAVAAYSIGTGGSLGVLSKVTGSPFSFPMWQVAGEPTGKYLIGTTGNSAAPGFSGVDDKNLYVFSIAQSGAITQLGAPFPTINSPLSIAVQQNASTSLIYAFGLNDTGTAFNPVEGFGLSSGGTLAPVNGSPFTAGAVGSEGQFDQSGSLLFVYGGLLDINTIVYEVTALDVSNNSLTVPTGTGTYGGYWVGTDAP
jgi:hypothetical protein